MSLKKRGSQNLFYDPDTGTVAIEHTQEVRNPPMYADSPGDRPGDVGERYQLIFYKDIDLEHSVRLYMPKRLFGSQSKSKKLHTPGNISANKRPRQNLPFD